jgi:hypothetical protein
MPSVFLGTHRIRTGKPAGYAVGASLRYSELVPEVIAAWRILSVSIRAGVSGSVGPMKVCQATLSSRAFNSPLKPHFAPRA